MQRSWGGNRPGVLTHSAEGESGRVVGDEVEESFMGHFRDFALRLGDMGKHRHLER